MSDIIKGNVIMLFIKQSGTYQAIAYGRSHELELEYDKDDVHSRLDGSWSNLRVTTSRFSITCEYLYSEDSEKLIDLYSSQTPLTVMIGLASNYDTGGLEAVQGNEWTIEEGYRGKVIITSIEVTASTSEIAQLTCTLKGISSLSKVNASTPEDDSSYSKDDRLEPTLAFTTASSIAQLTDSNEYTLSQYTSLSNPNGLPVRFIVEPYNGRLIL